MELEAGPRRAGRRFQISALKCAVREIWQSLIATDRCLHRCSFCSCQHSNGGTAARATSSIEDVRDKIYKLCNWTLRACDVVSQYQRRGGKGNYLLNVVDK